MGDALTKREGRNAREPGRLAPQNRDLSSLPAPLTLAQAESEPAGEPASEAELESLVRESVRKSRRKTARPKSARTSRR